MRLRKFYEIPARKKVLREETDYTERGREIWQTPGDCGAASSGFGIRFPPYRFVTLLLEHPNVADRVSVV